MAGEGSVLVAAIVLHGLAAVTFGLAFFGLWRAFGRRAAGIWAVAFGVLGAGSLLSAAVFAVDDATRPRIFVAILAVPAIMLLLATPSLLRWGTEALVGDPRTEVKRLVAIWGMAALVLVGSVVTATALGALGTSAVLRLAVPRVIVGVGVFWAAAPLVTRVARARPAIRWLALSMVLLAVRYLASAALAFRDLGAPVPRLDGPVLIIGQVGVLILFGVATTVALVGQERDAALESAATIRRTAEALRESETKFRFLIENSSDMIMLIDLNRGIRFIAPNCERHLGISPEAALGHDLLDLVHQDDRPRAREAFALFLETGGDTRVPLGPIRLRHQAGTWIAFEVSARLVRDPADEPLIVLAARDVTVQQNLQLALLQAQRLDSLGQMAARVAHDFNNLLVVVLCAADQGSDDLPDDHPARAAFRDIKEGAARGAELTRKLLMFARRQPTQVEVFGVLERLEGLRPIVERLVGPAIEVVVRGTEGWVKADAGQFDQVVINLAANARDAMPKGGRLTLDVSSAGPATVRLRVTDVGVGIPPAVMARLFEPFYTTKAADRGTGLGLATAYGFARQAGGTITVESEEGQGASFVLALPAALRPAPRPAGTGEPALPKAPGSVPTLAGQNPAIPETAA